MYKLVLWIYMCLIISLNAQSYPDTDELEPSNCFSSDFASDTCDNVQTPFTYTINSGSSYPAEGFCIVRNTSHDGITGESYQFSAALCASNGGFGGGIFFNFQDEYNYDTFYTMSEDSTNCIVGYVESANVYETAAFTCKLDTSYTDWFSYEVTASPGITVLTLKRYSESDGLPYSYVSHFPATPNAGPLHINDPDYHDRLHFAESTMIIGAITTNVNEFITSESVTNYQTEQPTTDTEEPPTTRELTTNYETSAYLTNYETSAYPDQTQQATNTKEPPTTRERTTIDQTQQPTNTEEPPTTRELTTIDQTQQATNTEEPPTTRELTTNYQTQQPTTDTEEPPTTRELTTNYETSAYLTNYETSAYPEGSPTIRELTTDYEITTESPTSESEFITTAYKEPTTAARSTYAPAETTAAEGFTTVATDSTTTAYDTTDEPTDVVQPLYEIRMEGDLYSSDGEDFSSSCMVSYSYAMDEKVSYMGFVVNSAIGGSLCPQISNEDIQVSSSSGLMSFNGDQGTARPLFYLQLASDLYLSDVDACISEIKHFLLPHSNWGQDVVAPVPDCPEVEFYNSAFNDLTDVWVCVESENNRDKQQLWLVTEPPKYGMGHVGEYNVEGGADLGIDCQELYSSVFYDNTYTMISGINNPVDGNHICGGIDVSMSVNSAFLSSGGSSGLSLQDYILELSGDMSFSDVYACADSILAYLSPHSKWMDPIIPQLPGCPGISFSPERFQERFQQWICVNSQRENPMKDITEDSKKQTNQDYETENEKLKKRKNMARQKMKKLFNSYLKLD